ncbi:type II toxin-antitoxin system HicB family antitoxin [Faecalibaculum rodentium]|uniref:type II toxin-antitoxin system HicB family antitoxin n=1 Tax=Faecalibaculum rodentium TaxID=1702221 RepID=UPI002493010B|nr:type II toxin-antitoxin system HicB family antitoxin [Faecalibaculum rodentium]
MKTKTYLAVMEPCDSGYGVYFPDFPGCVASGKTIDQAARIAKDALSMHYYTLEEESEEIPEPSQSLSAEDTAGNVVTPITIYPELLHEEYRNRRVKTNTTIPAWLKAAAEEKGINFSRVLENALMGMIN